MVTISTDVPFVIQDVFEPIFVTLTGSVFDLSGIVTHGGDYYIKVAGMIDGAFSGIQAINTVANPLGQLFITSTGAVSSSISGVIFTGSAHNFTNFGTVQGDSVGLLFNLSTGNAVVKAVNGGTIFSAGDAILIQSSTTFAASVTLNNMGTIIGGLMAYEGRDADSTLTLGNTGQIHGTIANLGTTTITNRGLIDGGIQTGDGFDTITNFGTITGQISTGGGGDTVTNLRGKGDISINLGAGDDFVVMGGAEENVFGDTGRDTVSYASSAAIVINLADMNLNRGDAFGDILDQVEVIQGSFRGDDQMTGDAGANQFNGLAGKDIVSGGAGSDTLEGGAGADRLTGGTGRDQFIFGSEADGGDTITDFTRGNGINADKIGIDFTLLAPGLLAAGRFQSRADNVAQDSDDLFIFRTTDHTLWSDQDGSGVDFGPVLLATFSNGVNLLVTDILIL